MPRKRDNKVTLSFRVTPEVAVAIGQAAERERRLIAHWLELAIEQILEQQRFLTRAPPRPIIAVKRQP